MFVHWYVPPRSTPDDALINPVEARTRSSHLARRVDVGAPLLPAFAALLTPTIRATGLRFRPRHSHNSHIAPSRSRWADGQSDAVVIALLARTGAHSRSGSRSTSRPDTRKTQDRASPDH